MTLDVRKLLSLLFLPLYLVLIAIILVLNLWTPFNPPLLLLVFNSLFLGLIPLYVAYIAYKSVRSSGSVSVLLMGTGMLMLGIGAIAAGIVGLFPDSQNINVATHNTSFCIGAFLQLVGILIVLSGSVPKQKPADKPTIATLYGGCVVFLVSFVIANVIGAVPPFFIAGSGYTVLRQIIIANAIEFFVMAAVILLWLYSKKREDFFFWYSLGLALIAIGLVGATFNPVLGSPLSWVSRSAQYLGACYILLAFIALNRSAQQTGIPLEDMLALFFGASEASYKTLVETATDAIAVFDSTDRVIVWNTAATKMFGYSQSEAIGSSFIQLAIPDEFTDVIKNNDKSPAILEAGSIAQKSLEIVARRKDGSTFPVELTLSRHWVAGIRIRVSTCIMRDLTERKRAEEHINRLNRILRALRNVNQLITTENNRDKLLKGACDNLTETRGYSCAWIALYDDNGTLLFTTESGLGKAFLPVVERLQRGELTECGNHVLRQSGLFIKDPSSTCADCPLATAHAEKMVLAARLEYGTKTYGMLVVSYPSNLTLDMEEQSLFQELVNDIAFGLYKIEMEEQRRKADEKIESLAKFPGENPTPIFRIAHDGVLLFANKGAEFLINEWRLSVGKKVPEFLGKISKEAMESGSRLEMEKISGDKTYFFTIAPIIGQNYVNLYGIDITERKKAEEELKISLAKYKVLFESFPLAITISDKMGNIVESNRRAEGLLGLSLEEQSKRKIDGKEWQLIRPDETPMPSDEYASVRALKENHLVQNVEMGIVKRNSAVTWICVTAAPIPLKDYGVAIAYSDITERKRAEDDLRKSELHYRSLFENMLEGFSYCRMLYDDNGQPVDWIYLSVNNSFDQVTGLKNIEGRRVTEAIPGVRELHPELFEVYGRVASTGTPETFEIDFKPIQKWLHISVYSPAKEYFVAVFEDITERKTAEEAMKTFSENLERKVAERTSDLSDVNLKLMTEIGIRFDAEKQLTKNVGEKEALLREVHHRVKNNLQIIISLLNLQSRYMTDEVTLSAFRESQNRIRVMALVHEKLYMSTDLSKIDLDNYIRFLGSSLFQFFGMRGKSITFTQDIRDVSLAIDTAIPVGLIINELISNSLKYAFPEGRKGEVSLAIQREDHMLTILFRDNGVGIPEDFDWRNAKSLGLRLIITLVDQLDGTIELDRSSGTAFTIVVKEKE